MSFRDDDDGQRGRAEELEAELARRDAELRARDDELRRKDAELERLRARPSVPSAPDSPRPSEASSRAAIRSWADFWRQGDWGQRTALVIGVSTLVFMTVILGGLIGSCAHLLAQ